MCHERAGDPHGLGDVPRLQEGCERLVLSRIAGRGQSPHAEAAQTPSAVPRQSVRHILKVGHLSDPHCAGVKREGWFNNKMNDDKQT